MDTPEQTALVAAIPRDLVTFAEEHGVSLTMLRSILDRLIGTTRRARSPQDKKQRKLGANERGILDAYNELTLNSEVGPTEVEVVDRAVAIRGEPTERKARNNMRTNFLRALRVLCRDEILLSMDGKLSMFKTGEAL